jgi:hypothetical protein
MIFSDRKIKIIFYGFWAFILGAFILTAILTGCSSTVPKGSPMTGQADLIDKIIDNNPNLPSTDKAILKAGADNLRYADKTIAAQDKEIDRTKAELVSEAKEAGAGRLTYALIGLAVLAGVVYILHKIKVIP